MNKCQKCGKVVDMHTEMSPEGIAATVNAVRESRPLPQHTPGVGDLTVCSGCGTISIFEESMDFRPMTSEELVSLNDTNPDEFDDIMKAAKLVNLYLNLKSQDNGKS